MLAYATGRGARGEGGGVRPRSKPGQHRNTHSACGCGVWRIVCALACARLPIHYALLCHIIMRRCSEMLGVRIVRKRQMPSRFCVGRPARHTHTDPPGLQAAAGNTSSRSPRRTPIPCDVIYARELHMPSQARIGWCTRSAGAGCGGRGGGIMLCKRSNCMQ